MKKIFLITWLLVSMSVQAQFYSDKYHEVEYRCEICGKYIFSYEKVPEVENGMVDPWFYMGNPNVTPILTPDSLENEEFSLNYSVDHICKECLNQYSDRIKKEMNTLWDSYWERKKSDNKERFAKYEDDKKSQEVKELEEKIKQLEQEKLYIIHPELKPKEQNFRMSDR
ncbi:MAG: hypothetical protein WC389_22185, partial [Lutibacter sp.]